MKTKSKIQQISLVWIVVFLVFNFSTHSQSGVKGNTFIHGNKEMMIFKPHNFVYGGSGIMPGIVCTKRNGPTYLSFSGSASVMSVSDAAHVDGYVKNYNIPVFTYPIGDNGRYCPITTRSTQMTSPIMAAYFGVDPAMASTSILLGGFEPPLPIGAPFSSNALSNGIRKVSNKEYWDVNGSSPVFLTLHWSEYSSIDSLTDHMLDALRITGWNGSQWIDIPASIDPGSTFANGKITTDVPIIPNSFNVYTFGSSCDMMDITFFGVPNDLYLCKDEQSTINIKTDRPSQLANATYTLQLLEAGIWIDVESNNDGNFSFAGFTSLINPKKYRIKWPLAESCNIFSKTFTHFPYRSVPLACLGNINVTLGHDCDLMLTPSMLLSGADLSGFYDIKIMDKDGNIKGNPLNYADINQSYMVTVVEKCSGNSCWTQINIEDKIKPVPDCGAPQQFECFALDIVKNENPQFLLSGINSVSKPPLLRDNCNNAIGEFKDRWVSGECTQSVIYRDWIFKDLSGNVGTCTQELRFGDINFSSIQPPQKEITLSCGQSTKPEDIAKLFDDPTTLDSPATSYTENNEGYHHAYFTYNIQDHNGHPHNQKIETNICNIFATYSDQSFPLCGQGCNGSYKIIRTWTLYNYCNNENITYTQIIKVIDEIGPEFSVKDVNIVVNTAQCSAQMIVPQPFNVSDACAAANHLSWKVLQPMGTTLSGASPEYILSGLTPGQQTLHYIVSDCCGNETTKTATITVSYDHPIAYCKPINIMWDPAKPNIKEFWAKDFDNGSVDKCTPSSELIYSFDAVKPLSDHITQDHYFTTDNQGRSIASSESAYLAGQAYRWHPIRRSVGKMYNTKGKYNIHFSVWNQASHINNCETYLYIMDGSEMIVISGHIATPFGEQVANTVVKIDADLPTFPKYYKTKSDGKYSFNVPVGNDYTLSASKGGDYLNGVSTLDLVLIQRHILGLQVHDTPYKVIASDGNDNLKITATDLTEIRKLILGVTDTMINQSWRFPVAGQSLDKKEPFPYIERYTIESPLSSQNDINFIGVKIGDVDGSVSQDITKQLVGARKNPSEITLGYQNKSVSKGELVQIPIKAIDLKDIFGFQGTWNLKNASFVSLEGNMIDLNHTNLGLISDSIITMSIALLEPKSFDEGAVIFTLTVRALQAGFISDIISLSSKVTPTEAYFYDLSIGTIKLNQITEDVNITLMQNEPNPFTFRTVLSFDATDATQLSLRITDVSGKLYLQRTIQAQVGTNTIELTNADLPSSGIYFYTLEGNGFKETRKMLKLE